MKKIVALVLSLVMVLGLATTAFAATAPSVTAKDAGNYYWVGTGVGATISVATAHVNYYPAVEPEYDTDTGLVTVNGQIGHYTIDGIGDSNKYVEVATLGQADLVLYVDADGDTLFKYLDKVETNVDFLGYGVAFADFGKACGQYKDPNFDKTATYYIFEGTVYKATKGGAEGLMVDGAIVDVNPVTSGKFVAHTPVYTYDKTFKVTAVTCSECGAVGVIVPNYASLPVADVATGNFGGPINTSMYYYWTEAPVVEAPADTTVESAQTFDAGIAMYVGMSIAAAAGSAVVLKKKD